MCVWGGGPKEKEVVPTGKVVVPKGKGVVPPSLEKGWCTQGKGW